MTRKATRPLEPEPMMRSPMNMSAMPAPQRADQRALGPIAIAAPP
jgi:hypothetical protein